MSVEIASAWVSIVPSMRGAQGKIQKELEGLDLGGGGAARSGAQIGDSILSGMGNVLRGGAIALGGIAVAGLGTAFVKGFQRLDALDQARAKLSGLGHDAQSVETIMADALAAVKGTAFGMGDAATVAAATVAAGVKPGEDLQRTLTLVGDAATIAGVDMATMGSIVNKVATSDMMQMDVANQLMDAGIPILQMVADTMGVTAGEAREMASAGEISFETFQTALESGLGGAALESGNTFSGAMDNVMAAMGRLGESLLGGAFENLKGSFGDLTTVLDDLQPAFEIVGAKIGEVASVAIPAIIDGVKNLADGLITVGGWIRDNTTWLGPLGVALGVAAVGFGGIAVASAIGAAGGLKAWFMATKIGTGIQAAFNLVMAANPIALVVIAVSALVGALIWFFTQTQLGQEIWANFTQFLREAWDNIVNFVQAAWENIVSFFTTFGQTVSDVWNSIWSAISDFFTGIWDGIVGFITAYVTTVQTIITTAVNIVKSVWDTVWGAIASFFEGIWSGIVSFVTTYVNTVRTVITTVVNTVKNVWNNVWGSIKTFFSNIWSSIVDAAKNYLNAVRDNFTRVIDFVKGIPDKILGFFKNMGTWLLNSGKALVDGFLTGIKNAWSRLTGWVSDGLQAVRDLFPFSPAKTGPFSGRGWVLNSGLSIGEAFGAGIASSLHDARGDVHDELAGIQDEFSTFDEQQFFAGFDVPELSHFRPASLTPAQSGAGGRMGWPAEMVIVDADRALVGRMRVESEGVVSASMRDGERRRLRDELGVR